MRNVRTLARNGAAAIGTGLLAVALNAAPAAAHYNTAYNNGNLASVNSGHTTVSVCRQTSTGDTFKAEFRNGTLARNYWDSSNNGSCTTHTLNTDYDDQWRVCTVWLDPAQNSYSCSSWRSL